MKKAKTASEARSYSEWVRLSGPTDTLDTEEFRVVVVPDVRCVDMGDGPVWVRRIGVLRNADRDDVVFAYDSEGQHLGMWLYRKNRPAWVDALATA
jgi:hypothetical protein